MGLLLLYLVWQEYHGLYTYDCYAYYGRSSWGRGLNVDIVASSALVCTSSEAGVALAGAPRAAAARAVACCHQASGIRLRRRESRSAHLVRV